MKSSVSEPPKKELAALYEAFTHSTGVCTDTRQLQPGCLFFALKGAQFDGNRFALAALDQGAAWCVADNPALRGQHPRLVVVEDSLQTLQALANLRRKHFDIPVVGIGGSNGKTTTKELLTRVMSSHYACHATAGNLNNHIGVPLTLLSMPEHTEIALIEMGTNQPGDIDLLCRIAEPTHGLITNIGKEHLEGFGSIEGVRKAEGELYDYLQQKGGTVFVNRSERYLTAMSRQLRHVDYARVEHLLPSDPSVIGVELIETAPFVHVRFFSESDERIEAHTHLPGLHNFNNVMTAVALGLYFKVPAVRIQDALQTYKPTNNRSQVLTQGTNTILLDAYNANPSSMVPALETLCQMKGRQKVAFLGDMLELGADSLAEHIALVEFAAALPLKNLVLVGPEFGRVDWQRYGALHFPNAAAAQKWYQQQNFENTDILIKGSRGIRMENVLERTEF